MEGTLAIITFQRNPVFGNVGKHQQVFLYWNVVTLIVKCFPVRWDKEIPNATTFSSRVLLKRLHSYWLSRTLIYVQINGCVWLLLERPAEEPDWISSLLMLKY